MPLYDARSDGFCGQGAFLPDARRQVKPGAGVLLISLGFPPGERGSPWRWRLAGEGGEGDAGAVGLGAVDRVERLRALRAEEGQQGVLGLLPGGLVLYVDEVAGIADGVEFRATDQLAELAGFVGVV